MANAWILRPLPIVAATSAVTAFGDPMYVGNDYAGVVWGTQAYSATQDIIVDFGSAQVIDTVLLFGIATTSSPTVTISFANDAGFTGTVYTAPTQAVLAGVLPTSGKGVSIFQHPSADPGAYRYMRLSFASFGGAGEAFSLSRVVAGRRIVLERNFQYGAAFGVKDQGSIDWSRWGVLLRRRGAKLRTVGLTFPAMTRPEVEATVQPLLELVGNTEPVALLIDPTPDTMRQRRAYFGPLVGDLGTIWRKAAAWQAVCNMVSLF